MWRFLRVLALAGVATIGWWALEAPARAQAPAALLTPADLPGEWVEGPVPDNGFGEATFCGAGRPQRAAAEESARAWFQGGMLGPIVYHTVDRTPDAEAVMEDFRALAVPCDWEVMGDGVHERYRLEGLSSPALGDDSLAYRLTADLGGAFLAADVIVIRRGGIVSLLVHAALDATAPPLVDTETTERLAGLADERLAAVVP
jgi:hypothetical protein